MESGNSDSKYDALWGTKVHNNEKLLQNGLPTVINGFLAPEHETAYQVMYRIAEITSNLRMNNLTPPSGRMRSPSPPPVYDSRGRRTNTREQRYKRKLEEERHRLVEIALRMIPHFVAPEDYRRPTKFQDKYYIPTEDYPDINFVGLLLGPRGNTLKKLQQESGCKISIRGRGSVRSGKATTDLPKGAADMNEPLHCIIIADTEEKIPLGIKACESIVVKAITSPEGQNDLKRGQLRELAVLNGTLREDNYVQTFGRKRLGTDVPSDTAKRFKRAESGIPDPSRLPVSKSPSRASSVSTVDSQSHTVGQGRTASPAPASPAVQLESTPFSANTPPGITPTPATPGLSAPGMQAPGMQAPGISAPGMQAPGMQAPGMQAPGMQAPGMSAPGMSAPGMSAPGMSAPGMSAPGMSAPGLSAPGTQPPRLQPPGMQAPSTTSSTNSNSINPTQESQ